MKTSRPSTALFAICVDNSEYPASSELHKIYRVVPDEDAKKDGDLRIIDESGEDYLYPVDYFLLVDMPRGIARALRDSFARRGATRWLTEERRRSSNYSISYEYEETNETSRITGVRLSYLDNPANKKIANFNRLGFSSARRKTRPERSHNRLFCFSVSSNSNRPIQWSA